MSLGNFLSVMHHPEHKMTIVEVGKDNKEIFLDGWKIVVDLLFMSC